MKFRSRVLPLFALAVSAPAAAQQPSDIFSRTIPQPPLAEVTVVHGSSPWAGRDTSLAERNLARVVVAVQDLALRGLQQAMIRVFDAADSTRILSKRMTDARSLAELDSLPAGDVIIEVLRLGMKTNRVRVRIAPGCTERLEIQLADAPICTMGMGLDPYRPPRATFRTCAPGI